MPVALALYQPDIPQNAGNILRLAACMGTPVRVIGPAGFDLSDRALRRAGMDYLGHVEIVRHVDWEKFESWRVSSRQRLVLLTTRGDTAYVDHAFAPGDILLLGRESAGVPEAVHEAADARLLIPMRPGLRSINVAATAAMALGEALRQTGTFPGVAPAAEGV
ncbi:MAG: tRNA (cytidine(34)-2'-O)-methyltransferase [Rhizobiales bacterium]|nr:tRNA (cytidine(34)-2'-O)-methyltransferase [Hyphomicrobiales bacterium]